MMFPRFPILRFPVPRFQSPQKAPISNLVAQIKRHQFTCAIEQRHF